MTARLLPVATELSSRGPHRYAHAVDAPSPPGAAARRLMTVRHRSPNATGTTQSSEAHTRDEQMEPLFPDFLWKGLLESLPKGVIVVDLHLKPIHWNARAIALCNALSSNRLCLPELPSIVSEVCHRLMRQNRPLSQGLVLEYQEGSGPIIRISARWVSPETTAVQFAETKVIAEDRELNHPLPPYILLFLENCTDLLREELRIEQRKYDLTDRETEIWMLLRQEYTYQEIARMLQISLNTVKTHVKNVYAKKRSYQGQEKFWCFE